jgi:predicted flap endonuclease-1-like 5' DNA nuclease
MGLLEKLKSLFRSDGGGTEQSRGVEAEVTVEREPSAASEHAVKGTREVDDAGGTDSGSTAASTADVKADIGDGTDTASGADDGAIETADGTEEPGDAAPAEAETETETAAAETETDTAETEPTEPDGPDDSPSVEEIKGIGPTYAERLRAAGIDTVADLAGADPDAVAEAAETSETRVSGWIERAQALAGPQDG